MCNEPFHTVPITNHGTTLCRTKEVIMCCNCEEASMNYSNGFQTYARPTAGPYIATTHVPTEYGPVYVA